MATITNPEIIREMLRNDGAYPGDPQASSVYMYEGLGSGINFAVFMREAHNDIASSPFVRNYIQLFSKAHGLTTAGVLFLSGKLNHPDDLI